MMLEMSTFAIANSYLLWNNFNYKVKPCESSEAHHAASYCLQGGHGKNLIIFRNYYIDLKNKSNNSWIYNIQDSNDIKFDLMHYNS